jgi:hypothetical protein
MYSVISKEILGATLEEACLKKGEKAMRGFEDF